MSPLGGSTADWKDLLLGTQRIVEELCSHDDLLRRQNELLEDVAAATEGLVRLQVLTTKAITTLIPRGSTEEKLLKGVNEVLDAVAEWTRPSKRPKPPNEGSPA